jgi:hypothetical protein
MLHAAKPRRICDQRAANPWWRARLHYQETALGAHSAPLLAVIKPSGIRQPEICRLRLAPASGISALMELWPSG